MRCQRDGNCVWMTKGRGPDNTFSLSVEKSFALETHPFEVLRRAFYFNASPDAQAELVLFARDILAITSGLFMTGFFASLTFNSENSPSSCHVLEFVIFCHLV